LFGGWKNYKTIPEVLMNPMLESTIEITEETFTQENGPIVNETEKNMSK